MRRSSRPLLVKATSSFVQSFFMTSKRSLLLDGVVSRVNVSRTSWLSCSLRIRWTRWLSGPISGNVVDRNRNFTGYGYGEELAAAAAAATG